MLPTCGGGTAPLYMWRTVLAGWLRRMSDEVFHRSDLHEGTGECTCYAGRKGFILLKLADKLDPHDDEDCDCLCHEDSSCGRFSL